MNPRRTGFYCLATCGLAVAYFWLYLNLFGSNYQTAVCPIKLITKIPCPSCGATRAIVAIFEGDYLRALNINPLGYIILSVMGLAQILLIIDLIRHSERLYNIYRSIDLLLLPRSALTVGIFAALAANWIWNIYKGL